MDSATAPDLAVPRSASDVAHPTSSIPGGAAVAVAGAAALALCNVLSGLYPRSDSTTDLLRWFGANAGLAQLVAAAGLVAAVLLVPGIWAVTHWLRTQTPVLAAVGGWLMATGYLVSTVLSIETLTTLSLLSAGVDPSQLADASDNHTPLTAVLVYYTFGLGALLGTLLLGIAMLRQRREVPVWAGVAMIASGPVRMIGLFSGLTIVGPPLASVLIIVGFVGVFLGRRRRTS